MLDIDQIRSNLQFKYYLRNGTPYLRATYKHQGYEHSVIVILSDDTGKIIDQRIYESMLAMQAYEAENPESDKPAEIVKSDPVKVSNQTVTDKGGTSIISAKSPRQLEKEVADEINRIAESRG